MQVSSEYPLYFLCNQMRDIIAKSCTKHLHIYSLNISDKTFPVFCQIWQQLNTLVCFIHFERTSLLKKQRLMYNVPTFTPIISIFSNKYFMKVEYSLFKRLMLIKSSISLELSFIFKLRFNILENFIFWFLSLHT